MSLALNKVPDKIVEQHIEYQEGRLSKLLGEPADSRVRSNPVRYSHSLASITFDLGMDYYQQEQAAERVTEKLSMAASFLGQSITLRQPHPNEIWPPTEYEKALALAFCFGSPETLAQVLGATNGQIFSQPDPQNAKLYRNTFAYCQILRRYVAGESLDLSAIRETLILCEEDNAWKLDRLNTFNKLRTLETIQAKDSVSFNGWLSLLLEDHEHESLHGDLQKLPDANMSLSAMLLAKLGKAKSDLECNVRSPYLPLHLIL